MLGQWPEEDQRRNSAFHKMLIYLPLHNYTDLTNSHTSDICLWPWYQEFIWIAWNSRTCIYGRCTAAALTVYTCLRGNQCNMHNILYRWWSSNHVPTEGDHNLVNRANSELHYIQKDSPNKVSCILCTIFLDNSNQYHSNDTVCNKKYFTL